jgi:hypothetical protein
VDFVVVNSTAVDFMIATFGRRFSFGFYPYDYYDDYSYDYPYGYYPYASSDSYADNGSCFVVQRRVHN